jgi:thiamine kinase-like enzyme
LSLLTAQELTWLAGLNVGKILTAQRFKQARTNEVFLLTDVKYQQTVFKRLNLKARNRKNRKQELSVQKLASDLCLSPKVLADCGKYRLQEYLQGNTLAGSAVDSHSIELLAGQLHIIHQLPAKHARPQHLSFELRALKKRLNRPIDEQEFRRVLALAAQLDKSSTKDVLCHGDLSFNNLLQVENGELKILDWEYAVLATAAYDLAACSSINALTEQQQAELISHYYSLDNAHLTRSFAQLKEECGLYRSVFNYLNQLWLLCF